MMMVARWHLWALVGALAISAGLTAAAADSSRESKKVVSALKPDDSLEHLDVFAGIERGVLDVRLVPQDEFGGNLLIENKGDKPLNVDLPPAFIGKQVLKQAPGQQPQQQPNGFGQLSGLAGQTGGGSQVIGGGAGSGTGNNGVGNNGVGNNGFGNNAGAGPGGGNGAGFFSVPTDKIVRVPYRSVCLEHGKPAPSSRMTYRLGKVEEFQDDPVLVETLKIVADGEHDKQAGQAAAWHVASKLSWKQLREKSIQHIGHPATRYFTKETLVRAQTIHETALARAEERDAKSVKAADAATEASSPGVVVKRD
jgi:hypothetical protein